MAKVVGAFVWRKASHDGSELLPQRLYRADCFCIVGDIIFLAGHLAKNTRGGSVTQQTEEVLQALDDTLAKAGVTKKNLASVNIYLSDMSTFDEMNAVWDRWVAADAPPTRATVEARLAHPDLAVEITAVASR